MKKVIVYLFAGIFVAGTVSFFFESLEQDRIVEKSLGIWAPDLASAMIKNQMFLVDRILTSFRSPIIEQVTLQKNGITYFSLPAVAEIERCQMFKSHPIKLYGEFVGSLDYCKSAMALVSRIPFSLLFWLLLSGFFVLTLTVQIASLKGYRKSLLNILEFLKKWTNPDGQNKDAKLPLHLNNDLLAQQMMELVREGTEARLEVLKMRGELEKGELLFHLASQVSHDLKSPCTALAHLLPQMRKLPESQRILARSSIRRISDIANTLLQKAKEQKMQVHDLSEGEANSLSKSEQVELISSLIDGLISEKRLQYRNNIGIDISANFDLAYGAFAKVNVIEFKRTISNLINNSCESFGGGKGNVEVIVLKESSHVKIIVEDNGKGIPAHVLEQLGNRGTTHGKEEMQSGSGLGVWHAKKTIESFGGSFYIESQIGQGTKVSLILPLNSAPNWFVQRLSLPKFGIIVSLDDDAAIHEIYKQKFQDHNINAAGIEHFTFSSAEVFSKWVHENKATIDSQLYLVDFELLDQGLTGLEVIERLGIGSRSILVSSRYEESDVRTRCEKLGVRLIPKGMVPFVPIEIVESKRAYDAILIDNDVDILHLVWQSAADSKGKLLKLFSGPDQFFEEASSIDRLTSIYVDSNLGLNVRGEEISKKIFQMGFKNIFLCTGYEASSFQPMPWIKGIVGKEPVF